MRASESSMAGGWGWENWSGEKGAGQTSKQRLWAAGGGAHESGGSGAWHSWFGPQTSGMASVAPGPTPTPTGFRVSWPPARRLGNFPSSLPAGRTPVLPEA